MPFGCSLSLQAKQIPLYYSGKPLETRPTADDHNPFLETQDQSQNLITSFRRRYSEHKNIRQRDLLLATYNDTHLEKPNHESRITHVLCVDTGRSSETAKAHRG
eukprot:TRINITY_DN10680_c0_g1_i1.p2 TRINITY_DN10680_c0_g1~~TRINITY_DN10680_c0_g1_i1.p2  ORF type:complete len:104 (+),score=37.22 TRINITY_DN10680_c0_g1_i1:416-727(+)